MDNYCVYKHTTPSGKIYIGITQQNPLKRWQNGFGYRSNNYFFKAILKYGWDNIHHEILYSELSKDEACNLEVELIAKLKSNDLNFGYNLSKGGEHSTPSEETRKKLSESKKGKPTWIKGQQLTDEHKNNIKNSLIGHYVSEETKKKMSENRPKKAVICVETGVVYCSTIEAERKTGIRHDGISNCCRNIPKYITAGGFHWQFYYE